MVLCRDKEILADRIEVNYYTTITPAIINYKDASLKDKTKCVPWQCTAIAVQQYN